ncbi:arsenate reductase family protein [Coralliovum pocilloporae]|uniref:arsenate reductase family protein n=1 Tax=Coralliovum pocilloporae TaxID=3066369 RepID=UPI003306B36B
MKFYGLKTCDTCRKAFKALTAAGHAPDYVDVRADGVSADSLSVFLDAFGAEALINRKSTTWRGLDDAERAQDPLTLLQANPTLMKRPVIETDTGRYLGWGKDVQDVLL